MKTQEDKNRKHLIICCLQHEDEEDIKFATCSDDREFVCPDYYRCFNKHKIDNREYNDKCIKTTK